MNQYPNGPQQPYQSLGQQYPPPQQLGQGPYPPQYPGYPPPGPQQPPRELIKVRCKQGFLTITDYQIKIGRWGREQSMSRAALTGVDYRLVAVSLFGFGGAATLMFHGQGGERVVASFVKPSKAKEIMQILGY
jgi:hypothetical protein